MPKLLNRKEQLDLINKVKSKLKKDPIIKRMFKDRDLSIDILDYVPMGFKKLDVSATTDHGVIYFNESLIDTFEDDSSHYLVHELTHYLQQCYNDEGTKSDGKYLDNEFEQESFQNQTEFISEHDGDKAAISYVEQVLDHHDVNDAKERKSRKDELLSLARRMYDM